MQSTYNKELEHIDTIHRMNIVTNIQLIQDALGYRKDNVRDLLTYSTSFLEIKQDKLIKEHGESNA